MTYILEEIYCAICITYFPTIPKDKADDVVASIIDYEISNDQAIKMNLCREHADYLSSVIGRLDDAIVELSKPYDELVQLASDVPGITQTSARYIIAEIGPDMTVFKSAKHLCSWAGLPLRTTRAPAKRRAAVFPGLVLT